MKSKVAPFDDGMHEFGPAEQYVFHLTRYEGLPEAPEALATGEESKVICTFESATSGQCWIVDPSGKVVEYVKPPVVEEGPFRMLVTTIERNPFLGRVLTGRRARARARALAIVSPLL